MTPHISVLLQPVLDALSPRDGGRYVDLTLGAGGHSEAILEACGPTGQLVGVDRDPRALQLAGERLARFGDRFIPVKSTFADFPQVLRAMGWDHVDGILLDAGVSSMQLDEAERGFSFRFDAPLDMRMGQEGMTAAELVDTMDELALTLLLREYGEMSGAHRVARRMLEARAEGRLNTTTDLRVICEQTIRRDPKRNAINPATRVFQALRIAVNDELGQLDRALAAMPEFLAPGGTAAVISFHSLEDRRVKRAFRDVAKPKANRAFADLPMHSEDVDSGFDLLRDVGPTDEECEVNPRSRSARLRCLRRATGESRR